MRLTIFIFLFVLLAPAAAFSQTQPDYEHTMARFMQYYNHNQLDSILSICSPKLAADEKSVKFTDKWMAMAHSGFGDMQEYKYRHKAPYNGDSIVVFKLMFSRFMCGVAVKIDTSKLITDFWFINSPSMDLLPERKRQKPSPPDTTSRH